MRKKEFLEKGYTDASLRTIASEADTSTNSIYVRFKDKEGLFAAIVVLWSRFQMIKLLLRLPELATVGSLKINQWVSKN